MKKITFQILQKGCIEKIKVMTKKAQSFNRMWKKMLFINNKFKVFQQDNKFFKMLNK